MKIAVAGKGGAGKTTIAGTIARAFARTGHSVLALDADANPMLGISLGIGPAATERLEAVRQALDSGEAEHQATVEGMVDAFGADARDGVRLVVVSRIETPAPGCPCCGVSPEQLMRELEGDGRIVVCDLEAGVGAVVRAGHADVVVVIAEPSAKSIEVARRGIEIASRAGARVVPVANRVRDDDELEAIRAGIGQQEVFVVPDDAAITLADRKGMAPIDLDPQAPGVRALIDLAEHLLAREAEPVAV